MHRHRHPFGFPAVMQAATNAIESTVRKHPEISPDLAIILCAHFTGQFVNELFDRQPAFTLAELRKCLREPGQLNFPTVPTTQSEEHHE